MAGPVSAHSSDVSGHAVLAMNGFTFQRGGLKPIVKISEERVRSELRRLWSVRHTSSAILSAATGDFIQAARPMRRGRMTCVVERWEAVTKKRYRAYQANPVVSLKDGVRLVFSAGAVPIQRDEWLRISQGAELFISFYQRRDYPAYIGWRDVTALPNIEHTVPASMHSEA